MIDCTPSTSFLKYGTFQTRSRGTVAEPYGKERFYVFFSICCNALEKATGDWRMPSILLLFGPG